MDMEKLLKPLMLIIYLFAFICAEGQFIGTGSRSDTTTVSEIKKHALRLSWTDQKVNVRGFIVEQFREDYYWFEDKTGKIKVEIEPKYMPLVPYDGKDELEIYGEVCYPIFGRIYIGAKKIEFTGKKR
jgi:uncharacterized protein (TIGR00156 family)